MAGPALVTIDLNDTNAAKGLAAFVADYSKQVETAKNATTSWQQTIIALNQGLDLAKKVVGGFFSVVETGVGFFKSAVLRAEEFDASIAGLAKTTGATTTQIQALSLAAGKFGLQSADLRIALKDITTKMFEAVTAGGMSGQIFKALGIQVQEFAGGPLRNSVDVLKELGEKFKTLPDGALKNEMAIQLLGREGMKMVGFLSQGGKAIDELGAKMEKMGLIATDTSIKMGSDLGKALNWTGTMMDGVYRKLGDMLIPGVLEATSAFNKLAEAALAKMDWSKVKNGIADMVDAFKPLVTAITSSVAGMLKFIDAIVRAKANAAIILEWAKSKTASEKNEIVTDAQGFLSMRKGSDVAAERFQKFAAEELKNADSFSRITEQSVAGLNASGKMVYDLGASAANAIRNAKVSSAGPAGAPSAANGYGVEIFRGDGGGINMGALTGGGARPGGMGAPGSPMGGGLGGFGGGGGGAGVLGMMGGGPKMIEASGAVAHLSNAVAGLGSAAASAAPEILKGAGAMRGGGMLYHTSGEQPVLPNYTAPDYSVRVSDRGGAVGTTAWGNGASSLNIHGPSASGIRHELDKSYGVNSMDGFNAMLGQQSPFGQVSGSMNFDYGQSGSAAGFEAGPGGSGSMGRMFYGMGSTFEGDRYNDWMQGGYQKDLANKQRQKDINASETKRLQGITFASRQQQQDQADASDAYQATRREAMAADNQRTSDIYQASGLRKMYGDNIPNEVMGKVPEGVQQILSGGKQVGDMFGLVGKSAQALSTALVAAAKALQQANFQATRNMQQTISRLKVDGAIA